MHSILGMVWKRDLANRAEDIRVEKGKEPKRKLCFQTNKHTNIKQRKKFELTKVRITDLP